MPQNYAGKTLRGRPFKHEDDLKGANFTRATLRGVDFKGLDLTNADFTNADIRSANFTNTILKNADFTGAKAGLQNRWAIAQFVGLFLLSTVLNFFSIVLSSAFTAILLAPDSINQYTIFPGLAVVFVLAVTCFAIARQGLTSKAAGTILVAFAFAFAFAVAVAFAVAFAGIGAFAVTVAVSVLVAVSVSVAGIGAGAFAVIFAFAVAVSGAGTVAVAGTVAGAVAGAVAIFLLGLYVAWRTYKGDEKFALARSLGIVIGAIGGTSFCGANLTTANFAGATLKSANFNSSRQQQTNLTHVCWFQSKQLDRARAGDSILSEAAVRDLLVTGNGYKKTYIGLNLESANLNGVNLESANLKRANLSHSQLRKAHLKEANLAKTIVTGADLSDAYLTGACLESWNIDHTTILENIDCQFVFLLQPTFR